MNSTRNYLRELVNYYLFQKNVQKAADLSLQELWFCMRPFYTPLLNALSIMNNILGNTFPCKAFLSVNLMNSSTLSAGLSTVP